MYLPLILFFISLLGIIIMIGKKLVLQKASLKNGMVITREEVIFELPHLEKVRHFTAHNIKKYGHISLIVVLRFYVRSMNFFQNRYQAIKTKIRNSSQESSPNGEKKEISKFLKVILDYKRKIREIKHQIKEEESL